MNGESEDELSLENQENNSCQPMEMEDVSQMDNFHLQQDNEISQNLFEKSDFTSENDNENAEVNSHQLEQENAPQSNNVSLDISKPCLICYSSFHPNQHKRSTKRSSTISDKSTTGSFTTAEDEDLPLPGEVLDSDEESNLLEAQIGVMFVVRKILQLPKSTCEEL